jgi:hypothetical protein
VTVPNRLTRALADPWTGLAAVTIGGVAWAASIGLPLAAGAAVVAYGVKVAYDAFTQQSGAEHSAIDPPLPEPAKGSPEAGLVARARKAVATLADIARTTSDQWSRDQIAQVGSEADMVVPDLLRAAGRLTVARNALARISVPELQRHRADLRSRSAAVDNPDVDRSRASVEEQLAIAARLDDTCTQLQAKLESSVFDLETLVAQAAEVTATSINTGDAATPRPVEALISDLAAVREGLRAADEYSRKALDQ